MANGMNIYTPIFLNGDKEVEGKFLIIAETEEEAILKANAILIKKDLFESLFPYSHWTPFANKVRINIVIDGILIL
jgi:hypothetical protein